MLFLMTETEQERNGVNELAVSVKPDTTQAVLHMERCQTHLSHRATTSYIRTSQFTPQMSGFSDATYTHANWPQTLLATTN